MVAKVDMGGHGYPVVVGFVFFEIFGGLQGVWDDIVNVGAIYLRYKTLQIKYNPYFGFCQSLNESFL